MKLDEASLHQYDMDGQGGVPPVVADAILRSSAFKKDAKDHAGYAYPDSDDEYFDDDAVDTKADMGIHAMYGYSQCSCIVDRLNGVELVSSVVCDTENEVHTDQLQRDSAAQQLSTDSPETAQQTATTNRRVSIVAIPLGNKLGNDQSNAFWYGGFPELFPHGRGGPFEPRSEKLPFEDFLNISCGSPTLVFVPILLSAALCLMFVSGNSSC